MDAVALFGLIPALMLAMKYRMDYIKMRDGQVPFWFTPLWYVVQGLFVAQVLVMIYFFAK